MDDPTTSGSPTPDAVPPTGSPPPDAGAPTIHCDQCGEEVPNLTWCVRCGDPLEEEQRRGRSGRVREAYAAAPGERANSLRIVSTLYPSLPREEIRTFQLALLGGTVLIVALGLLGFFPVAIVAAAILVPLVTIIYVYDVDVYEDEPLRVVAFTFLWGAITGALFSFAISQLFPITAASLVGGSALGGGGSPFPWVRGVIAPTLSVLIMIAGPLVLLPYKRFNDVLDGATFGVASGVAFVGAQTLVTAVTLFESGLRPVGDVVPWVTRLLVLGVAMPVLAAGAIGGLGGVLWLRYRAPVHDRTVLGPLGHPLVALLMAVAALLIASLAELLLPELGALIVVVVLAVIGLLWLRRIIHVGLLQEASEIPIGPAITCPDCGDPTPFHTYCGLCGVSLKALPRTRGPVAPAVVVGELNAPYREQPSVPGGAEAGLPAGTTATLVGGSAVPAATASPGRSGLGQRALLGLFAVVLLGAVLIAALVAYNNSKDRDKPDCSDRTLPCSGAADPGLAHLGATAVAVPAGVPTGLPFADRQPYHDTALGFGLEFDPTFWSIAQQGDGFLVLSALGGNVVLIFEGGPADQVDPQALFDARKGLLADALIGYTIDADPARVLLGNPILGYRQAKVAGLFGGVVDSSQGPSIDFSVASVAGTDGQITVAATVITPVELTITQNGKDIALPIREAGLSAADSVINSFTWPTDEVVQ